MCSLMLRSRVNTLVRSVFQTRSRSWSPWSAAQGRGPEAPRKPGAGELLIEVRVAALNYQDVIVVTGLMPDESALLEGGPRLGLECAGVVTATRPGVTAFATGDRVHAVCKAALSSLASFTWHRVISWWMALHCWKWKDIRRRFTDHDM